MHPAATAESLILPLLPSRTPKLNKRGLGGKVQFLLFSGTDQTNEQFGQMYSGITWDIDVGTLYVEDVR
jgi:hypothetical protein